MTKLDIITTSGERSRIKDAMKASVKGRLYDSVAAKFVQYWKNVTVTS